ncbi:MAG TPA: hypothetical protein VF116_08585 [Ktedonobacterales bacterium]
MGTTTNSLRQHIIEQVQRLDERHLKALQAYLRVLELSLPSTSPLPSGAYSPPASGVVTTPEEDAEFDRLLDEIHREQQP